MIRRGVIAGGVAVALIGVVWVVPRVMDWDRYRGAISNLAAQRLGRPVTIAGHVGLTILPQPEMTAENISVTDPVTGAQFTAREMRLRVGLLALLGGTIDPRALDLDRAQLRLPWPVPRAGFRMRPPRAFAATIRDATLVVGEVTVTAVNGTLATDGDQGAVTVGGTARVNGVGWQFDGGLGALDADHMASLTANFAGQGATGGAMLHLGGELHEDGSFVGQMSASGPDLGRVISGPHVRFSAEAKIKASGNLLQGSDLNLDLGDAAGQGSFQWSAGDPGFTLQLNASRLDLDQWVAAWLVPGAGTGSSRYDIEAESARFAGGDLRDLDLDMTLGPKLVLRDFSATLPGETAFTAQGSGRFQGGAWQIDQGAFTLHSQDITPSLAWLAAADPDLPVPSGGAALPADLAGQVSGSAAAVAFSGLSGSVAGAKLAGTLGFGFGDRTWISADLSLDQFALGGWGGVSLPPRLDYDLTIAAHAASLGAIAAQDLGFHLRRDQSGSRLEKAHATIDGAVVDASFARKPDGSFDDLAFGVAAPHLAPLLGEAPILHPTAAFAALPATLGGDFKGPAGALVGKIALDAGEFHLAALPVIDLPDLEARGAITLRDPGAWQLVQQLGGPDLGSWIGVGSLGVLARFDVKPGEARIDYFDAALGGMRLSGALDFTDGAGKWALNGNLSSDRLPLAWPGLAADAQIPADWLQGGSGKISLAAGVLTYRDAPVASDFYADLGLTDGDLSLDRMGWNWGAGTVTGSADWRALDPMPSVNLAGSFDKIAITGPITGGAMDISAGTASGKLILTATGHTPATWLATLGGQVSATVAKGTLAGFDLVRTGASVALPGNYRPQAALLAALKGGNSDFDQLQIAASIKDGGVMIDSAALAGPLPAELSGTADLPSGVIDLGMTLDLPGDAPPVAARYKGKYLAPVASVDLTEFKKWLGQRVQKKAVPARTP